MRSIPRGGLAGSLLPLLVAALAGCATRPSPPPEDPRHELTGVPFYPQTIHQCGPAALATVLDYSGVDITPEQLVPQVYLPGRKGSLQVELLAAARRNARIAYVLPPEFGSVLRELDAGNPVLVLQDLGLLGLHLWHFAVVVGFDPANDLVILRSGRERRDVERRARFLDSWKAGGNWAVVTVEAPRLPASANGAGFVQAFSDSEHYLAGPAVDLTYAAMLQRWPDDPLVLFAGANHEYAQGNLRRAEALYGALLQASPDNVAGLNNLANVLLDQGCARAALMPARRAVALVGDDSALRSAVLDTLAKVEREVTQGSGEHCPGELSPDG